MTRPEAAGLRHLAFYTEDIEKDVKELKEKGNFRGTDPAGCVYRKENDFFADPDGLPLELHE